MRWEGSIVISIDAQVALADSVVARAADDGLVLVNLKTGDFWELNRVGARIWQQLAQHGSVRRTLERIAEEHEVEPKILRADLIALLEDLRRQRLIEVTVTDVPPGAGGAP
jgi:hypothetical protein